MRYVVTRPLVPLVREIGAPSISTTSRNVQKSGTKMGIWMSFSHLRSTARSLEIGLKGVLFRPFIRGEASDE